MLGTLPRARPAAVLPVLRGDPVPDVPDHRRVGRRAARLRDREVLPVHDVRLGVPARRDPVPVREVRLAARRADVRRARSSRSSALATTTARWLFLAFFVAFAVKVPLFPLHTWLPDAHTEAPTAGSVILAAVLLKIGAVRPDPVQPRRCSPRPRGTSPSAISVLALIGIVYGAIVAMIQTDVKRLVAYSSVSHLGFVVLGIFAFTEQAMTGGVLQMVNHGLSTGRAVPAGRHGVRADPHARPGRDGRARDGHPVARRRVPVRGAVLDRAARPEQLRRRVPRDPRHPRARTCGSAPIAATAVVLAAIYLLWAYQRMAPGPGARGRTATTRTCRCARSSCSRRCSPLILAFGVYPKVLLDRIDPTTTTDRVRRSDRSGYPTARAAARCPVGAARREEAVAGDAPAVDLGARRARADPRRRGDRRAARRGRAPPRRAARAAVRRARRASPARRPPRSCSGTGTAGSRCSAARSRPTGSRWSSALILLGVAALGLLLGHHYFERSGEAAARVLPARAVRDGRDDADRGVRRPDHGVPRARDPVALALRADRLLLAARLGRGRDEVLPARRVLLGVLPVRRRDGLRRDGLDAPVGDLARARGPDRTAWRSRSPRWCCSRSGSAFKVVGGAVPHVDARRVPGRADGGDRVHVGRDEGRGVRRVHARVQRGVPAARVGLDAGRCGCSRRSRSIVGSVLAIAQTDIKRMLAYSSIAHAGFVLIGLTAAGRDGDQRGAVLPASRTR